MTDRNAIYETVTNKIIASLEAGTAPWIKPWKDAEGNDVDFRLPLRSNGVNYQGINIPILLIESQVKGYKSPYWFTFNQAKAMKANVKKGEKGTQIVFTKTFSKDEEQPDGSTVKKTIPMLRTYYVFNGDQIENLPAKYAVVPEVAPVAETYSEKVERVTNLLVIDNDVKFVIGGNRAFYRPSIDTVTMPPVKQFKSEDDYLCTLAHEVVHWSGAAHRLNRDLSGRFGSESYAMEELVAEMGAAFLSLMLGVTPTVREDHAQYIASWIKTMKGDKSAVFKAATLATQAASYIVPVEESAEVEESVA
jgi:antirestriction protein ArdC